MSQADLEARGVFLPQEAPEGSARVSSIPRTALLGLLVLALTSCVLMVAGGGGGWTWLGAGLFPLILLAFTLLASRGVDRSSDEAAARGAPEA